MSEKKEKSLWKKIKHVAVIALATLGVFFIIIMLLPEDEEPVAEEYQQDEYYEEDADFEEADAEDVLTADVTEGDESAAVADAPSAEDAAEGLADTQESAPSGNLAALNIPASEISDRTLTFKTVTLDNETVSQDIFKDYDLTIVHLWGTFCQPCVAEMGEYAKLYQELPDNINLIGIVNDVYDGLDSNVSRAHEILGNAGAEFVNVRTSDDLYDIVSEFQYVPSSFFVDREGHIVGSVLDGAGIDETVSRLKTYLE